MFKEREKKERKKGLSDRSVEMGFYFNTTYSHLISVMGEPKGGMLYYVLVIKYLEEAGEWSGRVCYT